MAMPMTGQGSRSPRPLQVCAPGFVGRETELVAIGDALSMPPAVVLVEGEAGIGKSRLVREFLVSPPGRQHTSLVAVCPPFRQPQTLAPIVEAVRRSVDDVADLRLSALGGALRPLFPEWGGQLPPMPEPAEDATAARHRLFRALAELFERLHADVVVLEDAHWADEVTLELLLFLTSREEHPSIVVTYRPEDVPAGSLLLRMPSRLRAGTRQLRLTLGALGVTEMARLMSSMLAGRHVSEEFAAFVHERTEGVPLAAEESVRLMVDRADLTLRNGRWVRRRLAAIDVPPTIRDAVLERVARVGEPARAVLRAAAILGAPTDEATLIEVCGLAADGARAGLAEALRSGLLTEDDRGRVAFRHALAGQAMYESISVLERMLLHRRAGEALEGWSAPPVARLARHFREAGETNKWCRYAEEAADAALAVGDDATSVALLHELVTGAALPAPLVVRLVNKMRLLALAGGSGLQDLVRVLRRLVDAGLPHAEEAEVRFQLGRVLLVAGEFDAYRCELEQAVSRLARDPVAEVRAMMLLGVPFGIPQPVNVHLGWLRRAAEASVSLEPAERLRLAVDRVTALLMMGEESGWAEAERLPAEASTGRERLQVTRAYLNIAAAAMLWGRYDESRRRLDRGLDLAQRYEYRLMRGPGLVSEAHLDWLTGAWGELAGRVEALSEDEELTPAGRLEAALITGLVHGAISPLERAEQQLEKVLDDTHRRGALEHSLNAAAALARQRLAGGRVEDALRVTDNPVDLVTRTGFWIRATELLPTRVEALVAAGRTDDADELVRAYAAWLGGRHAPAPRAAVLLCRALLAEGRGNHLDAVAGFARAAKAWQQLPRPYDALLAQERQARCLLDTDQVEPGVRLLSEVFEGLRDLGARRDADRVAHRLHQHGVRVRRPWRGGRRGYGAQLSPRELDVVRLLVEGQTNRQIAEALVLARQTVAEHVRSAMQKLDVSTRTALAVKAVELGVVAKGHRRTSTR